MKYVLVFLVLFTASTAMAGQLSSIYLLTGADVDSLSAGFQSALNESPNHQAVDWINPATGLSGSTVPIKSYRTSYGQICREYLSSVQLDGALQQAFGTACQQADGDWKIAGEKPVKRDRQQLRFVYVRQSQQQGSQQSQFAFTHPPIEQSKLKQAPLRQNFHSDRFHEEMRTFKKAAQPTPEQRRIEQRVPTKQLKLVAY